MAGEEKTDEKRILVVAVESTYQRLTDSTPKKPRDLRPLVKYMEDKLKKPATIVAVAAPRNRLKNDIKEELSKYTYDVIVSIGSSPTKFAKEALDEMSKEDPAKRIPIVFTAVSEPLEQGFVTRNPEDGKLYGNRLTGDSRGLQQWLLDCAERFSGFFQGDSDLYWIHRPDIYPSDAAHKELMKSGALPPDVRPQPIEVQPGAAWNDIARALRDQLPTKPKKAAGFFMIPDPLVVAHAADCIRIVQEEKGIPAFVQQLEWVCPGWNTEGPYALAGYGVTPQWVGEKVAAHVNKILDNPNEASRRPVGFPTDPDFKFWYNPDVAKQFRTKVKLPRNAKACPGGRPSAPKAAARGKATRAGKPKKGTKKR